MQIISSVFVHPFENTTVSLLVGRCKEVCTFTANFQKKCTSVHTCQQSVLPKKGPNPYFQISLQTLCSYISKKSSVLNIITEGSQKRSILHISTRLPSKLKRGVLVHLIYKSNEYRSHRNYVNKYHSFLLISTEGN